MATLRASSRRLVAALGGLLLVTAVQCAAAQAAGSTLLVSAVVPHHARIRFAPPASITLSEEDIARGYLELPAEVELSVQSNVPQGYSLVFELEPGHVRGVRVLCGDRTVLVGSAGAIASRPATGIGLWRETLQLRLRFELADDATAGQHAWPLRVVMMSH